MQIVPALCVGMHPVTLRVMLELYRKHPANKTFPDLTAELNAYFL
ncbi:hypothetical protein [Pseudomonas graminis]|nr:hypothetical protein [Pseudomonas graminis]